MIRTILALALVAFLAGCDTTSSSSVPSGAEAPRLTVTVLSGTKAAPVDSPTVRVAWEHETPSSITLYVNKNQRSLQAGFVDYFVRSSGDTLIKFGCSDSLLLSVFAFPNTGADTTGSLWTSKSTAIDTSKTIYCK